MKKIVSLLLLSVAFLGYAQEKFDITAVEKYQNHLNSICVNPKTSPLYRKERINFKTLDFFPINEKFYVTAKFVKTEEGDPVRLFEKTSRKPEYIKYGEAHFYIDGKPFKLNVYYNTKIVKNEKSKDNLFLPFSDLTTGKESYSGGRFIDLKRPEGETIIIDFNQSYNPCSAFKTSYLKSEIPEENHLDIEIQAGIKKYQN